MEFKKDIEDATAFFREGCVVSDDEFFDMMAPMTAMAPEIIPGSVRLIRDQDWLEFSLKDGFQIRIEKINIDDEAYSFCCDIRIPDSTLIFETYASQIPEDRQQIYKKIRGIIPDEEGYIYWDRRGVFRWDNPTRMSTGVFTYFNFALSRDNPVNQEATIHGPKQTLEQVIKIVSMLRLEEYAERLERKKTLTRTIFRELIEKAMHPSRVGKWIMEGVDFDDM
jgi:hypothetical protein